MKSQDIKTEIIIKQSETIVSLSEFCRKILLLLSQYIDIEELEQEIKEANNGKD